MTATTFNQTYFTSQSQRYGDVTDRCSGLYAPNLNQTPYVHILTGHVARILILSSKFNDKNRVSLYGCSFLLLFWKHKEEEGDCNE